MPTQQQKAKGDRSDLVALHIELFPNPEHLGEPQPQLQSQNEKVSRVLRNFTTYGAYEEPLTND